MSYYRKWKPSKTAAREFAETMSNIDDFCRENGIGQSRSSDSYYFTINGVDYRVSNHTIAASDNGMYRVNAYTGELEKVRESYHNTEAEKDLVCITASKTRIIEIYNNLKAGKKLDKRGYVIPDWKLEKQR